jgi:hypothetical protein
MDKTNRQQPPENEKLRELKITCMDNLLATPEVRVYFKDLHSSFLLVSAGCDATSAPRVTQSMSSSVRRTSTFYSRNTPLPPLRTSRTSL